MSGLNLLYPVFVQVLVTFVLMFRLAFLRVRAARRGQVKMSDLALNADRWPDNARQIGNAYDNQFQLPILFYLLVVLCLMTGAADAVLVALAWAFVVARLVHAFIHTGSNDLVRRFYAFATSGTVLTAMWLWFALRVVFDGL